MEDYIDIESFDDEVHSRGLAHTLTWRVKELHRLLGHFRIHTSASLMIALQCGSISPLKETLTAYRRTKYSRKLGVIRPKNSPVIYFDNASNAPLVNDFDGLVHLGIPPRSIKLPPVSRSISVMTALGVVEHGTKNCRFLRALSDGQAHSSAAVQFTVGSPLNVPVIRRSVNDDKLKRFGLRLEVRKVDYWDRDIRNRREYQLYVDNQEYDNCCAVLKELFHENKVQLIAICKRRLDEKKIKMDPEVFLQELYVHLVQKFQNNPLAKQEILERKGMAYLFRCMMNLMNDMKRAEKPEVLEPAEPIQRQSAVADPEQALQYRDLLKLFHLYCEGRYASLLLELFVEGVSTPQIMKRYRMSVNQLQALIVQFQGFVKQHW